MPEETKFKNRPEPEKDNPEKNLSLEERLRLVDRLLGITKGGPSMADELQRERRSDKW